MSDSVLVFRDKLLAQDLKGMAEMLHEGWQRKKTLASSVTNSETDLIYIKVTTMVLDGNVALLVRIKIKIVA